MGVFTSTPPTFTAGQPVLASDLAILSSFATAAAGAWTDWTPTLTNITQGSGTVSARYRQTGKTVEYRFKFTLGLGSAMGTSPTFSPPVAPHSSYTDKDTVGTGAAYDTSAIVWWQTASYWASGSIVLAYWPAADTLASITSTLPFTWATGDMLIAYGFYEAA